MPTTTMASLPLVAVIVLAATCLAPAEQVEQQTDEKASTAYSYVYEIEEDPGTRHRKIESRSGEHANGRYYVNSDHSMTDVKYFADEWGYHPSVKYRSSDNHSSSGTEFVLDEKAVGDSDYDYYELHNQHWPLINVEKRDQGARPHVTREKLTTTANQSIPLDDFHSNHNTSSDLKTSEDFRDINYTNLPQQQSPTAEAFSYRNQDPSANEIRDISNDLPSRSVSEDDLAFREAGNFGQRVGHTSEIVTSTPKYVFLPTRVTTQKIQSIPVPETLELVTQSTANSESVTKTPPVTSNVPEDQTIVTTTGSEVTWTTKYPIDYSSTPREFSRSLEQSYQQSSSNDSKGSTFANPIVVADVSGRVSGARSRVFAEDFPNETTSSMVLNSIQAGIALANAGKAYLIDGEPFDVISEEESESQKSFVKFDIARNGQLQDDDLEPVREANETKGETVEIQKSIELYHQNPSMEIHYPPVFQQAEKVYEWNEAGTAHTPLKNSKGDVPEHEDVNVAESEHLNDLKSLHKRRNPGVSSYQNEELSPQNYQYIVSLPQSAELDYSMQNALNFNSMKLTAQQNQPEKKIVENVPSYPTNKVVEKYIEKKVPVPHPIPVPIRIPLERVIEKPVQMEKQLPFTMQKLVSQSYLTHAPLPPFQVPMEKKIPIPLEVTKIIDKHIPVNMRHVSHYGTNHYETPQPVHHNVFPNRSHNFYPFLHPKPTYSENKTPMMFHYHPPKQSYVPVTKKVPIFYIIQPHVMNYVNHNGSNRRRQTSQRLSLVEKAPKDEYIGPVPPQPQVLVRPKTSIVTRPPSPVTISHRKSRQDFGHGSFRQSRIEYGFRPPMVPSIQYDEETASKVES